MFHRSSNRAKENPGDLSRDLDYAISIPYRLRVLFTENTFFPENNLLHELLTSEDTKQRKKVLIYIDEHVSQANPDMLSSIKEYFDHFKREIDLKAIRTLPGGEYLKNDESHLKNIFSDIDQYKICRHSYIIAIGGGALLDVVGFAAATAHRGIRHIRLPSTTLSQCDAGVGVKNGINFKQKKNFVGSFAPPYAVINDRVLLESLPHEESRNGYIEAIKVGLIKDKEFYQWIEESVDSLNAFNMDAIEELIFRSAELHLNHIATSNDPFEMGSTRPLDFGHWAAHKLEQLSNFSISHGEAVAIGLALDVLYAQSMDYLDAESADRIMALLKKLGYSLYADELSVKDKDGKYRILSGLDEFREHLGGELTITLLSGIGESFEVHEMDKGKIIECIEKLRR